MTSRRGPNKTRPATVLYMLDRAMKEHLLAREFSTDDHERVKTYFENLGILDICIYCGTSKADLWDHVTAVRSGGHTIAGNMAPACQPCNDSKGGKDYLEWLNGKAKKNPAKGKPAIRDHARARIESYRTYFGYDPPKDFISALSDENLKIYEAFQNYSREVRKRLSEFGLCIRDDREIESEDEKITIVDVVS